MESPEQWSDRRLSGQFLQPTAHFPRTAWLGSALRFAALQATHRVVFFTKAMARGLVSYSAARFRHSMAQVVLHSFSISAKTIFHLRWLSKVLANFSMCSSLRDWSSIPSTRRRDSLLP